MIQMKIDKMVTITAVKYSRLLKCQKELRALEAGGVANWEWYGEVMSDLYGDEDDE